MVRRFAAQHPPALSQVRFHLIEHRLDLPSRTVQLRQLMHGGCCPIHQACDQAVSRWLALCIVQLVVNHAYRHSLAAALLSAACAWYQLVKEGVVRQCLLTRQYLCGATVPEQFCACSACCDPSRTAAKASIGQSQHRGIELWQ